MGRLVAMLRAPGGGRWRAGLVAAATVVVLTACGAAGVPSSGSVHRRAGTADVAYAGSLQLLNDKTVGPGFTRATGYAYEGRAGGSFGLSQEIRSGEIAPNVFESIGAAPITELQPKAGRWYVQLASSPLVVAYSPHTAFSSALQAVAKGTKPLSDLFSLMGDPGFSLGRTNPETDPQGQAFYEMVELARTRLGLPPGTVSRVLGPPDNASQIFAETALDARLEAGQLDAASAFLSQAVQLHLPYIALPAAIDFGDPALATTYAAASLTLHGGTVVHGVPLVVDVTSLGTRDAAAAQAFVAYVLSPPGRRAFERAGYELLTPRVLGDASTVPPGVRRALASGPEQGAQP